MGLIELQRDGAVMTLVLNDVERRNVISRALLNELIDAIDVVEALPGVRAVVVTNRGTSFCAGANLSEFSGPSSPTESRTVDLAELFTRIRTSRLPFVGQIKGHCVGGGVGLAAVMDISVAVASATFGFSEVRLGVAPAVISVVVLPKMRPADAREHFLRGDRFDAVHAAEIGLINRAVDADDIDHAVEEIVNDLLRGAPGAIALSKQLTTVVSDLDDESAFAWTAQVSAERFASDEAREGVSAFLEKRPAAWVREWRDGTGSASA